MTRWTDPEWLQDTDRAEDEGREKERRLIIAWLRRQADERPASRLILRHTADQISRREHKGG